MMSFILQEFNVKSNLHWFCTWLRVIHSDGGEVSVNCVLPFLVVYAEREDDVASEVIPWKTLWPVVIHVDDVG